MRYQYYDYNNLITGITPPLLLLGGNGSASAAGGKMIVSCTAGQNMDWWYSIGRYGVLIYVPVNVNFNDKIYEWYFETTIDTWTTTNESISHSMCVLAQDDYNFHYFRYHGGGLYAAYALSGTAWADVGSVIRALPIKIRFVLNRRTSTVTYQYWNGSAWVTLGSRATIGTPVRFGWGMKTWSTLPAASVSYSDYEVYYDILDQTQNIRIQSGFEDGPIELPTDSGVQKYSGSPLSGMGVYFPSTAVSTGIVSLVGNQQQESWEDGPVDWPYSGIHDRYKSLDHDFPQTGGGARFWGEIGVFEDAYTARVFAVPEFSTASIDGYGRPHFIGSYAWRASYYNTAGEPWAAPTTNNFTGYGRDGWQYINGVKQATQAPWATESPSSDRSPRSDFPAKALIVIGIKEVVIFDLDLYDGNPNTLQVWMRFRTGPSSEYWAISRNDWAPSCAIMKNGVLYLTSRNTGLEQGRMHCLDFKGTTTTFARLFANDGSWIAGSGKTMVNRNANGFWTADGNGIRLTSNSSEYSCDVYLIPGLNGRGVWLGVVGDDVSPDLVYLLDNVPQLKYSMTGDLSIGGDQSGWNCRFILFDEAGWLWYSQGPYLVRNIFDYQQGVILTQSGHAQQKVITLPGWINYLTVCRNNVYAAVWGHGIYQVKRGSMDYWLAYTTASGGTVGKGRGKDNVADAGALLCGGSNGIHEMQGFSCALASYLSVSTHPYYNLAGGVTLLRVFDDRVMGSYTYPVAVEDYTYFSITTPAPG